MNKLIIILLFLTSQAIGQSGLIVEVKDSHLEDFVKQMTTSSRQPVKLLSKTIGAVLVADSETTRKELSDHPWVKSWTENKAIVSRGKPNDDLYGEQWSLPFIETEKAWDLTTGGLFDGKHDIVVAVLDDGFDIQHRDLFDNIYVNDKEIPNNGIDDDNNGYVDDYRGVNLNTGTDDHELDDHGTAVTGIIGAIGNNDEGMTGVMWSVKILPISDVNSQAAIIEASEYLLQLRRQWNATNGDEGALIVASNYSAGIDQAFGTDPQYKLWCDMYDELGAAGIISTGATTNTDIDVDVFGDMPTTCPSDYLISVTNTGVDDLLVPKAGYGAVNIDLGAPGGTEALSMPVLDVNSTYGVFNGTSGATPHVSGTVGLLYSLSCAELIDMTYDNPAAAATMIKKAILDGVDENVSLIDKTVSNGRLNAFGAIQQLNKQCTTSGNGLEINDIKVDEGEITLSYRPTEFVSHMLMISDPSGRVIYETTVDEISIESVRVDITGLTLPGGIYIFSIYNDNSISSKTVRIRK